MHLKKFKYTLNKVNIFEKKKKMLKDEYKQFKLLIQKPKRISFIEKIKELLNRIILLAFYLIYFIF